MERILQKEFEESKLTAAIKESVSSKDDVSWLSDWIKDALAKTYFVSYMYQGMYVCHDLARPIY